MLLYLTANERLKAGRYKMALIFFDKVLAARPDFAEAYLRRGITLNKLKYSLSAFDDFTAAIHYNTSLAEAYFQRGLIYDLFVNSDGFLQDMKKAIEFDNNNPEYLAYFGSALSFKEDYNKANQAFSKAIRIKPECYLAYFFKGWIYHVKNNYKAEISMYDNVLR